MLNINARCFVEGKRTDLTVKLESTATFNDLANKIHSSFPGNPDPSRLKFVSRGKCITDLSTSLSSTLINPLDSDVDEKVHIINFVITKPLGVSNPPQVEVQNHGSPAVSSVSDQESRNPSAGESSSSGDSSQRTDEGNTSPENGSTENQTEPEVSSFIPDDVNRDDNIPSPQTPSRTPIREPSSEVMTPLRSESNGARRSRLLDLYSPSPRTPAETPVLSTSSPEHKSDKVESTKDTSNREESTEEETESISAVYPSPVVPPGKDEVLVEEPSVEIKTVAPSVEEDRSLDEENLSHVNKKTEESDVSASVGSGPVLSDADLIIESIRAQAGNLERQMRSLGNDIVQSPTSRRVRPSENMEVTPFAVTTTTDSISSPTVSLSDIVGVKDVPSTDNKQDDAFFDGRAVENSSLPLLPRSESLEVSPSPSTEGSRSASPLPPEPGTPRYVHPSVLGSTLASENEQMRTPERNVRQSLSVEPEPVPSDAVAEGDALAAEVRAMHSLLQRQVQDQQALVQEQIRQSQALHQLQTAISSPLAPLASAQTHSSAVQSPAPSTPTLVLNGLREGETAIRDRLPFPSPSTPFRLAGAIHPSLHLLGLGLPYPALGLGTFSPSVPVMGTSFVEPFTEELVEESQRRVEQLSSRIQEVSSAADPDPAEVNGIMQELSAESTKLAHTVAAIVASPLPNAMTMPPPLFPATMPVPIPGNPSRRESPFTSSSSSSSASTSSSYNHHKMGDHEVEKWEFDSHSQVSQDGQPPVTTESHFVREYDSRSSSRNSPADNRTTLDHTHTPLPTEQATIDPAEFHRQQLQQHELLHQQAQLQAQLAHAHAMGYHLAQQHALMQTHLSQQAHVNPSVGATRSSSSRNSSTLDSSDSDSTVSESESESEEELHTEQAAVSRSSTVSSASQTPSYTPSKPQDVPVVSIHAAPSSASASVSITRSSASEEELMRPVAPLHPSYNADGSLEELSGGNVSASPPVLIPASASSPTPASAPALTPTPTPVPPPTPTPARQADPVANVLRQRGAAATRDALEVLRRRHERILEEQAQARAAANENANAAANANAAGNVIQQINGRVLNEQIIALLKKYVQLGELLRLAALGFLLFHNTTEDKMYMAAVAFSMIYLFRVGLIPDLYEVLIKSTLRLRRFLGLPALGPLDRLNDAAGNQNMQFPHSYITALLTYAPNWRIYDVVAAFFAFVLTLYPSYNIEHELDVNRRDW